MLHAAGAGNPRWSECGTLSELSPAAVEQLQAACTQAVTQSYADGVDALVFVAPKRDPHATPEEAAAAHAAAEAAVKIQKNKVAIVDDILQVRCAASCGNKLSITCTERSNRTRRLCYDSSTGRKTAGARLQTTCAILRT